MSEKTKMIIIGLWYCLKMYKISVNHKLNHKSHEKLERGICSKHGVVDDVLVWKWYWVKSLGGLKFNYPHKDNEGDI